VPVVPTCHYMMGGIPTNKNSQVITVDPDGKDRVIDGLYAVGECACVSVHGANRLGGNSLLDLVVFGRSGGDHCADALEAGLSLKPVAQEDVDNSLKRVNTWNERKGKYTVAEIRVEMKNIMQEHFGVFRTEDVMLDGVKKLKDVRKKLSEAYLSDTSLTFNTARIEALELDNMIDLAVATGICAEARKESRGAHARDDFPKRNDKEWIKHSIIFLDDKLTYRAVNMQPETMDPFPPVERVY